MSRAKGIVNPITAKEVRVTLRGHSLPVLVIVVNLILFLAGLLGVFGRASGMELSGQADYRQFLYVYGALAGILSVIVLILGCSIASGSISGEREAGTYDLLKSAGLSPLAIAGGKLFSAAHISVTVIVSAFPALLIPLVFGGPGLMEVFQIIGALLPLALFSITVGLYYSSVLHSTVAAAAVSAGTVFAFAAIPVLLLALTWPAAGTAAAALSGMGASAAGAPGVTAYLMLADPLTPVASLVLRQIGEESLVTGAFTRMGINPSSFLVRNLTLLSFTVQAAISLLFFILSVGKISE